MNGVRGVAAQGKKRTSMEHSGSLPVQCAFLIYQRNKFVEERICSRVVPAEDMDRQRRTQGMHRSDGLVDLASIFERAVCVCKRRFGIAK